MFSLLGQQIQPIRIQKERMGITKWILICSLSGVEIVELGAKGRLQKFCVVRVSTRASVLCVIKDHFGFNSWLLWCSPVKAPFTRREEDPERQNNFSFIIYM